MHYTQTQSFVKVNLVTAFLFLKKKILGGLNELSSLIQFHGVCEPRKWLTSLTKLNILWVTTPHSCCWSLINPRPSHEYFVEEKLNGGLFTLLWEVTPSLSQMFKFRWSPEDKPESYLHSQVGFVSFCQGNSVLILCFRPAAEWLINLNLKYNYQECQYDKH